MNRWKRVVITFAISILLAMAVGCHHSEDMPLWEQLDRAQYNRYKPRLDHMIEKYGEEFTTDVEETDPA